MEFEFELLEYEFELLEFEFELLEFEFEFEFEFELLEFECTKVLGAHYSLVKDGGNGGDSSIRGTEQFKRSKSKSSTLLTFLLIETPCRIIINTMYMNFIFKVINFVRTAGVVEEVCETFIREKVN